MSKTSNVDHARYDLARFGPNTTLTPQGFLRAPASFTRAGVFTYTRADGTKIKELRPDTEVFDEKSLATLRGAPVVIGHPAEGMINPSNAKNLAIGWTGEQVERKDDKIQGFVTVMDAASIGDVTSGKLKEISMGYRMRLDCTPGVHPIYGPYDQIQTNIRYNHVALGGTDWGRAGEDIGIRLDANGAYCRTDANSSLEFLIKQKAELLGLDNETLAKEAGIELWDLQDLFMGYSAPRRIILEKLAKVLKIDVMSLIGLCIRVDRKDTKMETITIGGIEFEIPKAAAQAVRGENTRLDQQIQQLKTENEKLQGRYDAQSDELKAANEKLEQAQDPQRLDSAVQERVDLINKAQKILGADVEIKGTKREIMESVLRHDNKDLDLSAKSDDYVEARFDNYIELRPTKQSDGDLGTARADAHSAAITPTDGRPDAKKAHAAMRERNANAWKEPLTVSTQKQ